MKVTKHKVNFVVNGRTLDTSFLNSKEKAMKIVDGSDSREYAGEIEIDMYCENCDKDLSVGDHYIKVDEYQRYCSDCYKENTFTTYSVGGEFVGDENDTGEYDDWNKED